MRLILWAACAATVAGCGYSFGGLIEHEAVLLPIFDNLDERRTHEFDLTKAVARELMARGVRVNDPSAAVELKVKILEITEPSVVEDPADRPLVGAVSFRIEATLLARPSAREMLKQVLEESASFSSGRSESRETARQEVIDRLARRVVTLLEKDW